MMRVTPNWARAIATLFTLAMFYASVCTTACATGFCPDQPKQAASHNCEPTGGAHHPHHSNAPAPEKPDCLNHTHPTSLFMKSVEVYKVRLVASSQLDAIAVMVPLPARPSPGSTGSPASDLAPPFGSGTPLYQQISVFRI